jgi:PAS domain S-box-containing protein
MPVQTLEELARIDSDWVWQTDAAQNFTYLSPEVERFLGRTAGALTGTSRMTIAANGGDGSFWEPYFTALDRRQAFTGFIYPYAHPDGHVRWFRISGEPVVAPDGTFCGYRGTGTDISSEGQARSALADALAELRTSHASLVEQNKRFEAALSNMTQGLCLFDDAARLVVYNQRYCELFGIAPDRLHVGMTQREICAMLVAAGRYSRPTPCARARAGPCSTLTRSRSNASSPTAGSSRSATARSRAAAGSRPSRTSPNAAATRRGSRTWRATTR